MKTIEINGNEIAISEIACVTPITNYFQMTDTEFGDWGFKIILRGGYICCVSNKPENGDMIDEQQLAARRNEIIKLWKEK
jgi:hypothetical protein